MLILDDFWDGNLDPMGHRFHPKEVYAEVHRRLACCEGVIKSELSEAGLAALEEFKQAELDSACLCEKDSFVVGFKLGAKLILDALLEPSRVRS